MATVAGEVCPFLCGWFVLFRMLIPAAVAFGYFETLFALRDPIRIQREITRFKSLEMLLKQVGHSEHLYEIFTDATEDLFTQTINAIQGGARDESFLVDAFNNEFASSAVITHFRVGDVFFCFWMILTAV
jgi:hypothetical protein